MIRLFRRNWRAPSPPAGWGGRPRRGDSAPRLAPGRPGALKLCTLGLAAVGLGLSGARGAAAVEAARSPHQPTSTAGSQVESFRRDLLNITRRSAASMVTVIAHLDPPVAESSNARSSRRRIGSGILIDGEGSIITTFSNIEDAYLVEVRTSSTGTSPGQPLPVRYLGADHLTNIALLQVDTPGRPARLGESGLITPGSPVVMVGGPQAGPSMSTFGAVEMDRGLLLRYSEVEMFRTSTPLFPGSIGAAIIGMDGRVVGMVAGSLNDSRTLSTGGLSGFIFGDRISSAQCSSPTLVVPIEKAQEIAAELRMHGRVARGFLGIQMGSVAVPPASGPGERGRLGVVVQRVMPGSPADVAGLRPGDRILRYSGSDVEVPDELSFFIASTRPGSRIQLDYQRNGQTREVTVELGFNEDLLERRLNRLRNPIPAPGFPEARFTQRIQTGRTARGGLERGASGAAVAPRAIAPGRVPGSKPGATRPDTTRPNGQ